MNIFQETHDFLVLMLKSWNIFLGLWLSQTLQLYLKQSKLLWQHLAFLDFFPICNIFPYIGQDRFFFSGVGPDILMNVLEDCIIFLIWAALVLFNFCLIKNKFLVWSFTKNGSFISFHGGICSRYSEINECQISRLTFPEVTKAH